MSNSLQKTANQLAQATANKQENCSNELANYDLPAFFTDSNGQIVRARVFVTFLDSQKLEQEI